MAKSSWDPQQVQIDRLVQSLDRLLHVGQHGGRRQRDGTAQDRSSLDEPSGAGTARVQSRNDPHGERTRGRQDRFPRPPPFLRHFREKCRDIQRVALGVCVQLSGDPRGQLPHTQRVGETLDLARRKGRKPNGRSRPSTRHPVESLGKPGDALAALRENGEHTLPDEAADHEQQRPEGVDVGPVLSLIHI